MARQTHRLSYRAEKARKYTLRRIMMLTILVGVIVGLTFMLKWLLGQEGDSAAADKAAATETETPVQMPVATPTPPPQLASTLDVNASAADMRESLGFKSELMYNKELVSEYLNEGDIEFCSGKDYSAVKGVITFAGNNYRDSFTYGTQTVTDKTLTRVWERDMGSLTTDNNGTWSGTGWTGMPLIVEWAPEVRKTLGVYDEFKDMDGFTEVIYPSMDGRIYFYELSTGKPTRDPINLGVVTKGTASLDPRGYPLLYTGQGIPGTDSDGNTGSRFRVISLIDNKVIWSFGGKDPFSLRQWQAYDSSALVDADTDTLITAGENGVLYMVKLNTAFDAANGTVSVSPGPLAKYRYTANNYGEGDTQRWWGVESSISIWHNYAFFNDNGGILQCVDLNTLKSVYALDVLDDSDTSAVIEEDYNDDTLYLYTANEVERQSGMTNGYGKSVYRKINALTGEVVWQTECEAAAGGATSYGGTLSTPHVGHGNISNMVIYSSTLVPVTLDNGKTQDGGRIVALDKTTGKELWRYEQASGYWSSPVVIYDDKDNAYLLQCDRNGMLRMHDPLTGKVLCEVDLGSRIESTPAVFGDMLVVGTRGQAGSGEGPKIIGVKIG